MSNSVSPSGVWMWMPMYGVLPLKNLAMSAAVPVGVYGLPCGETVTTMREERSVSPLSLLCAVQPAGCGPPVMP